MMNSQLLQDYKSIDVPETKNLEVWVDCGVSNQFRDCKTNRRFHSQFKNSIDDEQSTNALDAEVDGVIEQSEIQQHSTDNEKSTIMVLSIDC